MYFKNKSLEAGQGLLIVVLVMVIALTVGLSVAIRTTSNLRTSSEGENSERAFSAAEAGIEQSSISNTSVPLTSLPNNTSYQSTVTQQAGSGFNVSNGTIILKDEPIDVWLSTYPTFATPWTGTLNISWGSASDQCDPIEANNTLAALEVVVITTTTPLTPKSNNKVTTYLLDPCGIRSGNNAEQISTAGDTINGITYFRKKSISITSGLIARIIPLYSSTIIGVQNSTLPTQGTVITSTGTSDNTHRKILSFRGYPKLPVELFPFVFFSPK